MEEEAKSSAVVEVKSVWGSGDVVGQRDVGGGSGGWWV
jgi:hypothetical protein